MEPHFILKLLSFNLPSLKITRFSTIHLVHSLESSIILSSEPKKFLETLEDWLPRTGYWAICWRATKHGWLADTFHNNCDGIKPTLTLVKVVKNGKNFTFGGYATRPWDEPFVGSEYNYTCCIYDSFEFTVRAQEMLSTPSQHYCNM